MNCLDAQALISAAHDGEFVAEADLTAARAHCAECEECTAFDAGLRYLDLLPVPPAPEGLADRALNAVAPLAAERAELRALEAELAVPDITEPDEPAGEPVGPDAAVAGPPEFVPYVPVKEPSRFSWFAGPVRWATVGAATALAATALVAFVVFGLGRGAPAATQPTLTGNSQAASPDLSFGGGGAKSDSGTTQAPSQAPAPARAPDYLLYNGYVYSPGALLADANSATPTIGTLSTAFASAGAPQNVPVYRSPLTDGSIVVKGPDGLRLFTPVIRMMASVKYQLTSGKPIDRFGVWPVLPDRFPAPANSAGTPSFVAAGTDALGVTVYSATGRPVTEGFAVAPGTSAQDPAGGDPNWTWWAPAPAAP